MIKQKITATTTFSESAEIPLPQGGKSKHHYLLLVRCSWIHATEPCNSAEPISHLSMFVLSYQLNRFFLIQPIRNRELVDGFNELG